MKTNGMFHDSLTGAQKRIVYVLLVSGDAKDKIISILLNNGGQCPSSLIVRGVRKKKRELGMILMDMVDSGVLSHCKEKSDGGRHALIYKLEKYPDGWDVKSGVDIAK